jgi:very-short-patch-repair endonuclease
MLELLASYVPPDYPPWYTTAYRACESPAEQAMVAALFRTSPDTEVDAQTRIGVYRADFTVGRTVVEVDGHAWHQRSPEQVARDRRRDRYMTARGWRVLRFTGSEVLRDALACAAEVLAVAALDVLLVDDGVDHRTRRQR